MPPFNCRDLEGMFQAPKLCLEKVFYVPVSKNVFSFCILVLTMNKIMEPVMPLVTSSGSV